MNGYGALFSIFSAASFGLNNAAIRRGVLGSSASQALYITVIGGVPLLLVAAAATGQLFEISAITPRAYLLLSIAGVVHFLFGRYCNYRCIGAIGATRAGPIRSSTTPYSLVLAIILLGERPTWVNGLGILLVMISPLIMVERRGRRSATSRPVAGGATQPPAREPEGAATAAFVAGAQYQQAQPEAPPVRMAEGYLFGFLSAIAYGTSPLLVRSAIGGTGLGVLGALISYAAASAILLLSLALPGRRASVAAMDLKAVRWFLLAAFTVFLAQMFRYVALDLAPVTVVTPLQYTGAIFTLLFSFLINRNLESFSPRILTAIAVAAAGGLAIVLN